MKRKLIDLDLETERRLSILASANGNDHLIKIEKEIKKQKSASINQLSILDEINKNL